MSFRYEAKQNTTTTKPKSHDNSNIIRCKAKDAKRQAILDNKASCRTYNPN